MMLYSGNPNHTIFNLVETPCFLYETVSCLHRPEGYGNKPNTYSNDLEVCGMKCCCFWFRSEVKYLMHFEVFLDYVILPDFNAICIDFYAVKCLIYIYFV